MKWSIACLVAALSAAPAAASTTITGGNIVNQTWDAAGSPYIVQGDVTVPSGSTLTIGPGTTIQIPTGDMQGSGLSTSQVELTVHGTLVVNGTAASPVTFAGASQDAWYGIVIESDAASVVLDHAVITNAYTGVTYQSPGNVVSSFGLEIDDPYNMGLEVTDGTPAFDGLAVLRARDYAVYVAGTGSLALTNCVVAAGPSGSGIHVATSSGGHTVTVTNCTIDHQYYGVYNTSLSTVSLVNSIVTNSTSIGVYNAASVTYSDVWNNGLDYSTASAGTGCMSANPQYAGATDYHLQASSIAIDSGTTGPDHDAEDHVRPVDGDGINGAMWDMGAYEAGSTMTAPGDAGPYADDPWYDALGDDACIGCDPVPDGGVGGADYPPKSGGCCDAGNHGQSALVWVAIVGLALSRRRRRGIIS
jgi:hypothetical protein